MQPLHWLWVGVFIDIFAVGVIIPLLPFYATQLGAEPWVTGLLGTAYGLAQLAGSPIMGKISDQYGRKTLLLVSFVGAGVGYLGTAMATSMYQLFLTRIPVGLVKQTMNAAKSYTNDISDDKEYSKRLAAIGICASLGFVFGPLVGGYLSTYNTYLPAYISSFLFLVDFILIWIFLPESNTKISDDSFKMSIGRKKFDFNSVNIYMWINFIIVFGLLIFRSNYTIFTQQRYQFTPKENGILMAYSGFLEALSQTTLGKLTSQFSNTHLLKVCSVVWSLCFFGFGVTYSWQGLALVSIPFIFSGSIINSCLTIEITKSVKKENVGVTLGISDSMESFARVISPAISGFFMTWYGVHSPAFVGGFLSVFGSVIIFTQLEERRKMGNYLQSNSKRAGQIPRHIP